MSEQRPELKSGVTETSLIAFLDCFNMYVCNNNI